MANLVPSVGAPRAAKLLIFVALALLMAYVLPDLKSFTYFMALALLLSQGRTVPLGAILAVLIGLAIPWLGVLLIVGGLITLMVSRTGKPVARHASFHDRPAVVK